MEQPDAAADNATLSGTLTLRSTLEPDALIDQSSTTATESCDDACCLQVCIHDLDYTWHCKVPG